VPRITVRRADIVHWDDEDVVLYALTLVVNLEGRRPMTSDEEWRLMDLLEGCASEIERRTRQMPLF
jgi:hypothetical protein